MEHVMNVARLQVEQMLACKEENEHEQLKIIKASLTKLIRRWCDTKPIVFVSEKAEKRADELGVDLFKTHWKDQPKFDSGRKIFHLEHKYAVSDMIKDMLKETQSVEKIFEKYEQGWILKCEDSRLKKMNRINSDLEYQNAKIKLRYRVDKL